jgi:hypothetical protein
MSLVVRLSVLVVHNEHRPLARPTSLVAYQLDCGDYPLVCQNEILADRVPGFGWREWGENVVRFLDRRPWMEERHAWAF